MKHTVGGAGQRAKVVFNESNGNLKIWEKGWIGKRKYRVNLNQISSVACGYFSFILGNKLSASDRPRSGEDV